MKVLSLDTTTPRGSIALLAEKELAAELRLLSLETHSARLLGSIDSLLRMVRWKLSDLDLVVAGIGPGSFTGIRIGVATALGLAQTASIPFAGISCLDAAAFLLRGIDARIGVVMDAQRSQVYYAEYQGADGRVRPTAAPALLSPSELGSRLRREHLYLVGDGAVRYAETLVAPKATWPRVLHLDLFLAPALGRLALSRKRAWRSGKYLYSEPLYIRPPDALRQRLRAN